MSDRLIEEPSGKIHEGLDALIDPNVFIELNENHKSEIIHGVVKQQWKDGGLMGRLFGTDREIASRNIAFATVILLIVVGVVANYSEDKQIWSIIIPAITTVMGYFFGKSA